MFITRHSGQAMTRSSIIGDDLPPCIKSGIDSSAKLLRLTATTLNAQLGYRVVYTADLNQTKDTKSQTNKQLVVSSHNPIIPHNIPQQLSVVLWTLVDKAP